MTAITVSDSDLQHTHFTVGVGSTPSSQTVVAEQQFSNAVVTVGDNDVLATNIDSESSPYEVVKVSTLDESQTQIVTSEQPQLFTALISDIPRGPVGPKGDTGDTGEQGPQGIQGEQGEKGDVGSKGDQGIQGESGPQGVQGVAGPMGPRGDQGPTGATGATGPQGAKGNQGEKGDKGDTGPQGPIGLTGPNGPKGDQGQKGETGNDGGQGIQGVQGPKGDTGEQGPQGISGIDGADGQDGEQGIQGVQGIQGISGVRPSDVSVTDRGVEFSFTGGIRITGMNADENALNNNANFEIFVEPTQFWIDHVQEIKSLDTSIDDVIEIGNSSTTVTWSIYDQFGQKYDIEEKSFSSNRTVTFGADSDFFFRVGTAPATTDFLPTDDTHSAIGKKIFIKRFEMRLVGETTGDSEIVGYDVPDDSETVVLPIEEFRGPQGPEGEQGQQGIQGRTGTGISSIVLIDSDIIQITYGDSEQTLDVNIVKGATGIQGERGLDGIGFERAFIDPFNGNIIFYRTDGENVVAGNIYELIDSEYVGSLTVGLDSEDITDLIDSDYINNRVDDTGGGNAVVTVAGAYNDIYTPINGQIFKNFFTDSVAIYTLVDSDGYWDELRAGHAVSYVDISDSDAIVYILTDSDIVGSNPMAYSFRF